MGEIHISMSNGITYNTSQTDSMKPERATKFGLVAATGILFISFVVYQSIQETRSSFTDDTLVYPIVIVGTVASLVFLFLVIGEYVERILKTGEAETQSANSEAP